MPVINLVSGSDNESYSDSDSNLKSMAESDDGFDSDPAFDHEYDRVRGQVRH